VVRVALERVNDAVEEVSPLRLDSKVHLQRRKVHVKVPELGLVVEEDAHGVLWDAVRLFNLAQAYIPDPAKKGKMLAAEVAEGRNSTNVGDGEAVEAVNRGVVAPGGPVSRLAVGVGLPLWRWNKADRKWVGYDVGTTTRPRKLHPLRYPSPLCRH